MTQFDLEMKLFAELINKYKPVSGHHLVLDLADYRLGKETIRKFKVGCEIYRHYVNVECHDHSIETVIITSNIKNQITCYSKNLYAKFSYDQKELMEFEDLTPPKQRFKRTMQQEMNLLCYELNNPQPVKPIC